MRPTLFHIPHEIAGVPLFGIGWAFGVCVVVLVAILIQTRGQKLVQGEWMNIGLGFGLVAALVVFILPNLEAKDFAGNPIGLPIRGYGAFMLFAFLSGVLLAAYRAKNAGLSPDIIYSVAFWMFVAGIVGARAFFVIEYWKDFQGETLQQTIVNVFKFTEGGLVVYGSLIGALGAFVVFCGRHKLPCLPLADIIAPSLVLGLAIGRLGCLMNSCCYGGVCLEGPSIRFPQSGTSQPYIKQIRQGKLLGLQTEDATGGRRKILSVEPGSIGERNGLKAGQYIVIQSYIQAWLEADEKPDEPIPVVVINTSDERQIRFTRADLPDQSLPVHPTQLYSSFNAFLLCLIVLAFHPLRSRDGQTLALLLTLYPITRFLLELIRTDEPMQFGTMLTISQLVSIGVIAVAIFLWVYSFRRPAGRCDNFGQFAEPEAA